MVVKIILIITKYTERRVVGDPAWSSGYQDSFYYTKRAFEFAVDLRDRQVIYQHIRFTSVVSALLKIVWLWTIYIISNYLVKENKIPPWLCKFLFLFSVLVLSMFSVGLIATKCNHKCYHISLKKAKITRVTLPSQ